MKFSVVAVVFASQILTCLGKPLLVHKLGRHSTSSIDVDAAEYTSCTHHAESTSSLIVSPVDSTSSTDTYPSSTLSSAATTSEYPSDAVESSTIYEPTSTSTPITTTVFRTIVVTGATVSALPTTTSVSLLDGSTIVQPVFTSDGSTFTLSYISTADSLTFPSLTTTSNTTSTGWSNSTTSNYATSTIDATTASADTSSTCTCTDESSVSEFSGYMATITSTFDTFMPFPTCTDDGDAMCSPSTTTDIDSSTIVEGVTGSTTSTATPTMPVYGGVAVF